MTTDVAVAIPWRPEPDRIAAHSRVVEFWNHHGFPIVHGDSKPRLPFNLAQARNDAVRRVEAEVVIVSDADTIPDIGSVVAAIERPGVTWPFTKYRHIPVEYVDRPDLMSARVDQEYYGSVGGIFVARRETYWQLGGMDERFTQWGYEDSAFHLVAKTLSTVNRLPGIVFSFNHSANRDMTDGNPNKHRYHLYEFACGKPNVMRELVKWSDAGAHPRY
jgi:N-terminal domain of galactosyltransferase